jgi:hypothetical protein
MRLCVPERLLLLNADCRRDKVVLTVLLTVDTDTWLAQKRNC